MSNGRGLLPDGRPWMMADLPAEAFPLVVTVLGQDDEVLWSVTVDGPGALPVPGFQGRVKLVRIEYGNGAVYESKPEGVD